MTVNYTEEDLAKLPYGPHHTVEWLHYLTHDEVDALQAMARALPDNPIVAQIGAGAGTSALALLQARDDLVLYSIDIQKEASPFGCLDGEKQELDKVGLGDSVRYHQVHGDSKVVGREWMQTHGFKVDMCFVDGGHSYEECKGDLEIWETLVKPHGLIAIHDFEKVSKVWVGVNVAVRMHFGYRLPYTRVDTLIAYEVE